MSGVWNADWISSSKRVDDLRVLQDRLELLFAQPVLHVRVLDDLHQAATVVDLADDVLDDALFDRVGRDVLEELL